MPRAPRGNFLAAASTKLCGAVAVPVLQPAVCVHIVSVVRAFKPAVCQPSNPYNVPILRRPVAPSPVAVSPCCSSVSCTEPNTRHSRMHNAQLRRQTVLQQAQQAPRPQAKATTRPQQWLKASPRPQQWLLIGVQGCRLTGFKPLKP